MGIKIVACYLFSSLTGRNVTHTSFYCPSLIRAKRRGSFNHIFHSSFCLPYYRHGFHKNCIFCYVCNLSLSL